MKLIITIVSCFTLFVNVKAQPVILTEKVGSLEIIKPSKENFVLMLEMTSGEWVRYCKDAGYSMGSPYTSPRTGYLLVHKGEVDKGGSNHISKMANGKLLYEWYFRGSDPKTVFSNTLIQLENNIVKVESDAVLYEFRHKGKEYSALLLSGGSQVGFLIQPKN